MRSRIADVFFALVLLLAVPGIALADGFTDSITDQLRRQGYSEIVVTRTFLGRYRILASTAKVDREIIVNPGTGEILRDYTEDRDASISSGGLFDLFGGIGSGDSASDSGTDDGEGDDGDAGNGPGDGSGDGAGSGGSGGGGGHGGSGDSGDGDSGDGDD